MDTTTVELTLRMIAGLLVVLGGMALLTRLARRRLRFASTETVIDVCARQQLTKSAGLAVVRAGSRYVLIGINDTAVTLLTEGDDLVGEPPSTGVVDVRPSPAEGSAVDTGRGGTRKRRNGTRSPASSGTGVVAALREKTVRRG